MYIYQAWLNYKSTWILMGVTFINCTLVLCYRLCLSTFLQPQCQGRHKTAWSILIFLRLLFVTIIILRWLMSARQVMVKCNSLCKWVQSKHLHICLLQMIRFKKEWEWISPEARFAAQRREVAGRLERELREERQAQWMASLRGPGWARRGRCHGFWIQSTPNSQSLCYIFYAQNKHSKY